MPTLTNPTAWLDTQLASRPLTVLVFFRGSWCPFCQSYLRELNREFVAQVRAAGGELFAITSHGPDAAAAAHEQWGLTYEAHSEPTNSLAQRFGVSITPKAATPLAGDPAEYPAGMAQPAVIALDGAGNVLFRWAIIPSEMNIGGASDRPLPADIWRVIAAKLAGRDEPLTGERKLDPAFLAEHYPDQHATFQAFVAASRS
jgi:thiol-disulfide isomerase/thioredoxin